MSDIENKAVETLVSIPNILLIGSTLGIGYLVYKSYFREPLMSKYLSEEKIIQGLLIHRKYLFHKFLMRKAIGTDLYYNSQQTANPIHLVSDEGLREF